ncbi:MAG: phytanoyl-CoA dioxygenase family protein, partial [Planctomycetota bacterium]
MDSASARFYFDHLFVKQPGTDNPTPWHQDAPYWPFRGRKIC